MREFIILSLKGKTTPDFDLINLKEAGRLDLVCRCVSSALFVSDHIRNDTVIHAALNGPKDPPKLISFYGDELKNVQPDEVSIGKVINSALKIGRNLKTNEQINVQDGINISKKSFEQLLKETFLKNEKPQLIYLHKKGKDIREFDFKENIFFVLGDNFGIPKKTEKFLDRFNAEKVSVSPVTLFASHTIVLVNNEIDRKLYL